MAEPEMTPDERERFEREQIHHQDVRDSARPASQADSERTPQSITTSIVIGNPD